ncbi:MAG: hypothetical protein H7831_08275 [Magnetococcus sp. WYHC-3]
MRVTQNILYGSGVSALQGQYSELARIQEQSLSGQRLNTLSDDPVSVYRGMLYSSDLSEVERLEHTTGMGSQRLIEGEDRIRVIHEKMLSARDLVLQLGNTWQEGQPNVLDAAAQEALALFQDVMSNANGEFDGVPLFSGGRTELPFSSDQVTATPVRQRGVNDMDFSASSSLSIQSGSLDTTGAGYPGIPASVRLEYDATSGSYAVNINGEDQGTVSPTGTSLDLGWVSIDVDPDNPPEAGDSFNFEVIPEYRGGSADRQIKLNDRESVPGNVTGAELVEGEGLGRGQNLFAVLTGVYGALKRQDADELSSWLGQLNEGVAQASDLQSVTGVRTVQVESVTDTLNMTRLNIEETRALNVDVDLFQVMAELQKVTQTLQVSSSSERTVLNTSLLDFLK